MSAVKFEKKEKISESLGIDSKRFEQLNGEQDAQQLVTNNHPNQ